MRGERVVVRDFKGRPVVCRVWDEDQSGVYVVNEEGLKLLQSHEGAAILIPIGFPREDVFEYDPGVVKLVGQESADWSRLNQWKEKAAISN